MYLMLFVVPGLTTSLVMSLMWNRELHVLRDENELQGVLSDPQLQPLTPASFRALKSTSTKYRPLLYKKDIRLLVLHPADNRDNDIHFHLKYVSLESPHPKFEALSYAWGDPTPMRTIYESNEPVTVRQNLFLALRHLRYSDDYRVLWIDTLCIDQSDFEERSQQVRLMGDVFSEADRVVVWLGEATADIRAAFWNIAAIHSIFRRQTKVEKQQSLWFRGESKHVLRRTVNGSFLGNIDWEPIRNLLQRSWFHRLWVVQEVANAKRAVVVCGDAEIPWSLLSGALRYLTDNNLTSKFLDRQCDYACVYVTAMETLRRQRVREPLFNVVLAGSYGGCSDPRDKIFAVMSIAEGKDIFDWEISFDYSLSHFELFKRFAIWDIIRCDSLRSLSCATPSASDLRLPSRLPSWAPDWTQLRNTNLFIRWKDSTGFEAAGATKKEVWFTHNKTMLHAKGAIVDNIQTIGSVPQFIRSTSLFEVDENVVQQLISTNEWLRECWSIAAADKPMTAQRFDAFWRTMTCNLTHNGRPAPRAYSKYFRRYMAFMREAPSMLHRHLQDERPIVPCRSGFRASLVELFSVSSVIKSRSVNFHKWFNKSFETNSLVEASLTMWASCRRFCRTEDGRLAQVPQHAAAGDSICVLHGSDVPYVLRLQEDGTFVVIGECYVHRIMHGEALELPSYEPEIFRIQ